MNYLLSLLMVMATSLFSCQQAANYTSLNVDEFESLIKKGGVQLVDVRTPGEHTDGYIPGSMNIDVLGDSFKALALDSLSKNEPVAVYCKSGNRSKRAAEILAKEGYKVYELSTGFNGWQQAGKKTTR